MKLLNRKGVKSHISTVPEKPYVWIQTAAVLLAYIYILIIFGGTLTLYEFLIVTKFWKMKCNFLNVSRYYGIDIAV